MIPVFGVKEAEKDYQARYAAYAILMNEDEKSHLYKLLMVLTFYLEEKSKETKQKKKLSSVK